MKLDEQGSRKRLAALALCGLAVSGCQSLRPPQEAPPVSVAAPAEHEPSPEALALYGQGVLYEQQQDFDRAIEVYEQVIGLDPDFEKLRLRVAMLHVQLQHLDQALDILEKLRRSYPETPGYGVLLASTLHAAGRLDEALALCDELAGQHPGEASVHAQKASLLFNAGREGEGLETLREGLAKAKDPRVLHQLLASYHLNRAAQAGPDREKAGAEARAALASLRALADAAPEDAKLLMQLGELQRQLGEWAEAADTFERLLALEPSNQDVQRRLAFVLVAAGRDARAAEVVARLLGDQPAPGLFELNMAELFQATGQAEKALDRYRRALEAGADASVYLRIALLQLATDPPAAFAALREGLERHPNDLRLHETLAHLLLNRQEFGEALAAFKRLEAALAAQPDEKVQQRLPLYYALSAFGAEDMDETSAQLQRAAEADPDFTGNFVEFVLAQDREAWTLRCVPVLERLSEAMPESPQPLIFLGLVLNQLEEHARAVEVFDRAERMAVRSGMDHPELAARLYFWFGAACERDQQFRRATDLFRKCLAMDPDFADAYNYLAYMWAEQGENLGEAMLYIEKALTYHPDNAAYIDTLGWVLFKQGRHEEALKQLLRADELDPDHAEIVDHVGDAYAQLGEREKAVESWRRAYVLDPGHGRLGEKLAEAGVDLAPLDEAAAVRKAEKEAEQANRPLAPLPDAAAEPGPQAPPADEVQ